MLAAAERALKAGDLDSAQSSLIRICSDEPTNGSALLLMARVSRRQGRAADATVFVNRAAQHGAAPRDVRRESALSTAAIDFSRAEKPLQAMLNEAPDPEIAETLTRGLARQERWLEANEACARWLELQPDRTELFFERGQIRQHAKLLDDAIADYLEVIRREPDNYGAHLRLADCLLFTAHVEDSEEQLVICRRLHPLEAEPIIGLAGTAIERRQYDRAQELLSEALRLDPQSSYALHEQGNLYMVRKRYDLAIPVFEKLLKKNDHDKQAHLKLSQALRYQGEGDRARLHARRFEELERADK
jgi:tetratricopeptide (TPR) repeat protein